MLEVSVDPKLAVPETAGLAVEVGGWLVTSVATDQTVAEPTELV